ncbi:uncharacterized protein METZ01_LOCUS362594, partial [marine metagenome]
NIGGDEFSYKAKYETSTIGAGIDNKYDELRGYNDFNLGFGGRVPKFKKLHYWISGQQTSYENYRVYKFDSLAYIHGDPGNTINKQNMVQPWDDVVGFRGFGFDNTWDIFGKLAYKASDKLRFQLSYWVVSAHRKIFSPSFLYWDKGQNEMFRDTDRIAFEMNHSLSAKTFYTIRYSWFNQNAFTGVRWSDSDSDGFPDWFEWSYGAGSRTNGEGDRAMSDIHNPFVVPYVVGANNKINYLRKDGNGPKDWNSGWYHGAIPGNYNWDVAEEFTDLNGDKIYQLGENFDDVDGNGIWTGPTLVEECEYRDGS